MKEETIVKTNLPVLTRMVKMINKGLVTLPFGAKRAKIKKTYLDFDGNVSWYTISCVNWQYVTCSQMNVINQIDPAISDEQLLMVLKIINEQDMPDNSSAMNINELYQTLVSASVIKA